MEKHNNSFHDYVEAMIDERIRLIEEANANDGTAEVQAEQEQQQDLSAVGRWFVRLRAFVSRICRLNRKTTNNK